MVSLNSHPLPDFRAMPPPATPVTLMRRPTLGSKRDSSYVDTDDESGLSLSTKKLKVAFDPHVDVRIMSDSTWKDKSLELVRHEVRTAVEKHTARAHPTPEEDEQYNAIVQMFKQDAYGNEATSSQLLAKYITQIETESIKMDRCGRLVIAILDLPWLGRNEVFLSTYIRFLVSLNSAYVKYLQPTLERMVGLMEYLPSSLGRLPSESIVSRQDMYTRLYAAFKTILKCIPSASNMLLRAIRTEYPNELATTKTYVQFQKQLMRLMDHIPELKTEIMAIIVQRLVALDVQIQQDLEDLEEEDGEDLLDEHNQVLENDSDFSDDESVASSEETRTEEEERMRDLRLKVVKMDMTMDLLFKHYSTLIQPTDRPEDDPAFQELITMFETYILPNRTRHSQFLVFHFAQISENHALVFAQQCIERASHGQNKLNKLSSIAYLSSFLARAARIPRSIVRQGFSILANDLDDKRRYYERNGGDAPDRRAYIDYYAIAQALLYIFCFRWRYLALYGEEPEDNDDGNAIDKGHHESTDNLDDILADHKELRWLPGIKDKLHLNMFCSLNPLKICAPAIVNEFAAISRHVSFIEVLSKLESNKRVRLRQTVSYYGGANGLDIGRRETAMDRKSGDAHLQLEPYFPFDPYLLPVSKSWIDQDYNQWELPRDMKKDDDAASVSYVAESESEADDNDDEHDEDVLDDQYAD